MHREQKTVTRFRMILPVLFVFLGTVSTVWSADVAGRIEKYVVDVDKDIAALTTRKEMVMRNIRAVEKPMKDVMRQYPQIESLMRVNSKGLVVNEIVRQGRPGKQFRKVGHQSWFSDVSRLKTYYGMVQSSSGETFLFRAFPIRMQGRSGVRCGGAIVAKIGLAKSMEQAGKQVGRPVQVFLGKKRLVSLDWDNSAIATKASLNVEGVEGLSVRTAKAPPSAVAGAGEQTKTVSEAKAEAMKAPAMQEEKTTAQKEGEKAKKNGSPLVMIAIFLVVGIVLLVIAVVAQRIAKKRHDALIESIEKESAPFEHGETVVMSRDRLTEAMKNSAEVGPVVPQQAAPSQAREPEVIRQHVPAASAQAPMPTPPPADPVAGAQPQAPSSDQALTDQIRKEVYAEVRFGFLQNLKQYSTALNGQLQALSGVISQPNMATHARDHALRTIFAELQQLRDAIEGRPSA